MADVEAPEVDYEAANAAFMKHMDQIVRSVCYSKSGGSTACKTYLDSKTRNKRITLECGRSWFKKF